MVLINVAQRGGERKILASKTPQNLGPKRFREQLPMIHAFFDLSSQEWKPLVLLCPIATEKKNTKTGKIMPAKKSFGVSLPLSSAYLAYAWGVGKNYPQAVGQKLDIITGKDGVGDPFIRKKVPFVSVVNSRRQKAALYYSPKKLFINAFIKEKSISVASLAHDHTVVMHSRHLKEGESQWKTLSDHEKTVWECLAREHNKRQPLV